MIRKINVAFLKQKHPKLYRDIINCKKLKQKVQKHISQSYWGNIDSILSGNDKTQNKFWKFIKSCKLDRTGTSPLKDNGLTVSDAKGKAAILSRQYNSLFSKKDISVIHPPVEALCDPMYDIKIDRHGIINLLLKLKDHKACGPDLLPTIILKAAAEPI